VITNLTGRTIRIYAEDRPDGVDDIDFGLQHTIDPDGAVQLTPMPLTTIYQDDQIPVELVEYGHAEGLPAPQSGVFYVVPLEVALAQSARRDDLLVTYRTVTTADGTVIGCRELAQPV
jgi:hypothetical protein